MAALRYFNSLASWRNAENSLQSVNLIMPRHGLRILASRGRDRHQGAPPDHLPAFGRYGDFEDGIPAAAEPGVHARRPSWSVRTMSSVIGTKSREITYSGSPPSSLRGQTVTAAIAAAGQPERKQEKRQKFLALPLIRVSNARRWSSVGHGGCLPGGGAGGRFSGPPIRPEHAGPNLLKAGCGSAATEAPKARVGKGRAWCADPGIGIDMASVSC